MFPLEAPEVLRGFLDRDEWVLVSAASPEERWTWFAAQACMASGAPKGVVVLNATDPENYWAAECGARQQESLALFRSSVCRPVSLVSVSLADERGDEIAARLMDAGKSLLGTAGTLVVDFTTCPTEVYFPLFRAALREAAIRNVVAVYTEPDSYGVGELADEPKVPPAIVSPFDFLPATERVATGWIPILGFSSGLPIPVFSALAETRDLSDRVFPLLGFPGFDPTFFERSVGNSGGGLLAALRGSQPGLRDRLLFAAAADPFETRDAILALTEQSPEVYWIGSALGPKPMNLGMLLAAVRMEQTGRGLSIMQCRPVSHSPEYSKGAKRGWAYLLKIDGDDVP